MTFTIDGQRAPKPAPMEAIELRDPGHLTPNIFRIPAALAFESTERAFTDAGGWINTVPMGLE